jgi:propanol-preferring alcohol dehydrogenase
MLAVRLPAWQSRAELAQVPAPQPGPGEVLLDVQAAGLCHTDLHLMEWEQGTVPYDPPFTLGHEIAGVVSRLGPGAAGVSVGDRVVVYSRWGCGICRRCAAGRENICERPAAEVRYHGAGLGRDGGLAEQVVVPSARYLIPIGDLDAALAAPLADAGITPYHALSHHRDRLRPGNVAVVIGAGGLGQMAVQMLRALSSVRVVAVDLRESALLAAADAGAHATVPADGLSAADLRAEVGPGGADLVLDFVGSDATLALASGTVATGGAIVYAGRGGGTLGVRAYVTPFDASVTVTTWGTIPELFEVVALARAGAITVEAQRYPLDQALQAYEDLEQGRVLGRAVALPKP